MPLEAMSLPTPFSMMYPVPSRTRRRGIGAPGSSRTPFSIALASSAPRLWSEQSEGAKFWLRVMNELKTCMDGLPAEHAKRGDEHAQHRRQWRNAGPAEHDREHAANAAFPLQLRIALRAWRPARRRSWE